MPSRSQDRMRERQDIYPTDSAGRAAPRFLATIANKTNAAGAVSVNQSASFARGVPAGAFSATGLPTGLTINASTGVITGTAVEGVYNNVVVRVTNSFASVPSNRFTWTITED
jgi:hypothetical protein